MYAPRQGVAGAEDDRARHLAGVIDRHVAISILGGLALLWPTGPKEIDNFLFA
jgi:hypothetical protein